MLMSMLKSCFLYTEFNDFNKSYQRVITMFKLFFVFDTDRLSRTTDISNFFPFHLAACSGSTVVENFLTKYYS